MTFTCYCTDITLALYLTAYCIFFWIRGKIEYRLCKNQNFFKEFDVVSNFLHRVYCTLTACSVHSVHPRSVFVKALNVVERIRCLKCFLHKILLFHFILAPFAGFLRSEQMYKNSPKLCTLFNLLHTHTYVNVPNMLILLPDFLHRINLNHQYWINNLCVMQCSCDDLAICFCVCKYCSFFVKQWNFYSWTCSVAFLNSDWICLRFFTQHRDNRLRWRWFGCSCSCNIYVGISNLLHLHNYYFDDAAGVGCFILAAKMMW